MGKSLSKKFILILTAVVLIVVMTTAAAYAYFSSYDVRGGSLKLSLQPKTTIVETPTDKDKTIVIKNIAEEGGTSVVVRVFVYGPDGMKVSVGDGWVRSGDCWYYSKVLKPGEETTSMLASIEDVKPSLDNSDTEIIVLHESAAAVYDEDNIVIAPEGWTGFPVIKAEEAADE